MGNARTAVKTTAAAVDVVFRPPPGLVVLIYHRVGRRSTVEVDLPVEMFADQMRHLIEHTRVVTLSDGLARLAEPGASHEPMVAVTFDDGTADFADVALPVLAEYSVPVTLYVATDFLERGVSFPDDGTPLSWAALRDTTASGLVDVGSHTHTHALLDRLDADAVPASSTVPSSSSASTSVWRHDTSRIRRRSPAHPRQISRCGPASNRPRSRAHA